jgi:hypothetical protein
MGEDADKSDHSFTSRESSITKAFDNIIHTPISRRSSILEYSPTSQDASDSHHIDALGFIPPATTEWDSLEEAFGMYAGS